MLQSLREALFGWTLFITNTCESCVRVSIVECMSLMRVTTGNARTLPSSTNVTLFCLDRDELGSNSFIFCQNSPGCFTLDVVSLQNSLIPVHFSELSLLRCNKE